MPLLDYVRDGDTVDIWKFDQLGSSTKNMLDLIETIEAKGCDFESSPTRSTSPGQWAKQR